MITLATDFGTPYPAAMRGVIRSRTDAELVDIAHDFPRQDVRTAAFWLRELLPYYPPATHCVVVDPGVGTDRAAIVIEAGDHRLVAPDNGVALPAARRLARTGGEPSGVLGEPIRRDRDDRAATADTAELRVWRIGYENRTVGSSTFHGRDVFAPAAAAVHDTPPAELAYCERVEGWVDLGLPEPTIDDGTATGEVLVVDGFGNCVTNVPGEVVDGRSEVRVNGDRVPVERAYAAREPGERLVTVASHGNVELAVNQGRGDEAFSVAVGDRVTVAW